MDIRTEAERDVLVVFEDSIGSKEISVNGLISKHVGVVTISSRNFCTENESLEEDWLSNNGGNEERRNEPWFKWHVSKQ